MNELKITFVNVGYGESILVRQAESGFSMLIDAGSAEPEEYADGASGRVRTDEYLRAIGLDHIDLMVSTHIHEDHLCGMLPVAERLCPATLWQTLPPGFTAREMRDIDPAIAPNASASKFIRALNDARRLFAGVEAGGGRVTRVCAGMTACLCPGLTARVLAPGADRCDRLAEGLRAACAQADDAALLKALAALDAAMNNYSLILMLEYSGVRVLLPGDTNRAGYGDIAAEALRADVFKVGHHGQKDGADPALIDAVRPRLTVCCASSDRRYESAAPALLDALRRRGSKLLFSDCPPAGEDTAPPHNALTIAIDASGAIAAEYENL